MLLLIIIAALAVIGLGFAVYNLCFPTLSKQSLPIHTWRPTVASPPTQPSESTTPQDGQVTTEQTPPAPDMP